MHVYRERDRKLVRKKKEAVLAATGKLECEACGFDFLKTYGERGSGFIEVHHLMPISKLSYGVKTKLSDLVILCANCHRMIHAKAPWIGLNELRVLITASRK